jgi:hypothetical protein
MSAALELQKAVFAVLTGDAGVGALVGDRIYDATPRKAQFPYLNFGSGRTDDWSTGTEEGEEHSLTLHAWSREPGKRETYQILEAVKAALHDTALDLDGHRLVNLRFESAQAARDPDGITWHGVMRFRAVTEIDNHP